MKKIRIVFVAVLLTVFNVSRCDRTVFNTEFAHIRSIDDLKNLFSKSSKEVATITDDCIERAKKEIQKIIAIPADQRTFKNTAFAFDHLELTTNLQAFGHAFYLLKDVSPDAELRQTCRDVVQKLSEFEVDWIRSNVELYQAFKEYVDGNAKNETLRDDQKYFLKEAMKGFKRAGLGLPEKERAQLVNIKKQLVDLGMQFLTNMATANRVLTLEKKELAGMDDDFIDALKKDKDGNYLVPVNMPNYFAVLANGSVEQTRKQMYHEYTNRAYPKNSSVLSKIIALRDELAKTVGYKSFAHFAIEEQMMKSPDRVIAFLDNLCVKSNKKNKQEFEMITKHLPEGVTLAKDGKMKVWDISFVNNAYKKTHFGVDEVALSEYFQLEHTLDALFVFFSEFFGVRYERVAVDGFWHPEVKLVKIFDSNSGELLSYMLLDLHPRENKRGSACHFGMLPSIKTDENGWPALSFILANFPKSTTKKPSLLKREQVRMLFHEFGHAMHHVLGKTRLASFAGTSVKRDFVEVPSKLMEEWLWNARVLKNISKHYKTGESISDEQIEKILALRQFGQGLFFLQQSLLARFALDCHDAGAQKDLQKMWKKLYENMMPTVAYNPEAYFYSSFRHLIGYNAKYYSYIWSRMLCQDIFAHIEKEGLFRQDAGARYVDIILSAGGSKDPDELMRAFLGREPSDKAFFASIGVS